MSWTEKTSLQTRWRTQRHIKVKLEPEVELAVWVRPRLLRGRRRFILCLLSTVNLIFSALPRLFWVIIDLSNQQSIINIFDVPLNGKNLSSNLSWTWSLWILLLCTPAADLFTFVYVLVFCQKNSSNDNNIISWQCEFLQRTLIWRNFLVFQEKEFMFCLLMFGTQ